MGVHLRPVKRAKKQADEAAAALAKKAAAAKPSFNAKKLEGNIKKVVKKAAKAGKKA